jgi:hypothetical protein
MARFTCWLLTAALIFLATPAWCATFSFSTGLPDGRLAAASRIPSGGLIEIEAGDDFITTAPQTAITTVSFWGLLPGATPYRASARSLSRSTVSSRGIL